ncbi:MAG: hypothetical protein ABW090_05035 [Sedimenticola sp.]
MLATNTRLLEVKYFVAGLIATQVELAAVSEEILQMLLLAVFSPPCPTCW